MSKHTNINPADENFKLYEDGRHLEEHMVSYPKYKILLSDIHGNTTKRDRKGFMISKYLTNSYELNHTTKEIIVYV